MGTLGLVFAVVNIFIAGMQFTLWLVNRQTESLIWVAANFAVGVYCLVVGVGGIVKTVLGG